MSKEVRPLKSARSFVERRNFPHMAKLNHMLKSDLRRCARKSGQGLELMESPYSWSSQVPAGMRSVLLLGNGLDDWDLRKQGVFSIDAKVSLNHAPGKGSGSKGWSEIGERIVCCWYKLQSIICPAT